MTSFSSKLLVSLYFVLFTIVMYYNKAFKLFKLVLVVYCISCWQWWHPVNLGSLKNVCKAQKLTGTLVWVYMEVLRSLVPMPIGLSNKLPIFLLFGKFTTKWVIQVSLAFVGWGSTPQTGRGSLADLLICWRQFNEVPIIPGPGSAARGRKTKKTKPGCTCEIRSTQRRHSQSFKAVSLTKQTLWTINIYSCQTANF